MQPCARWFHHYQPDIVAERDTNGRTRETFRQRNRERRPHILRTSTYVATRAAARHSSPYCRADLRTVHRLELLQHRVSSDYCDRSSWSIVQPTVDSRRHHRPLSSFSSSVRWRYCCWQSCDRYAVCAAVSE